MFLGRMETKKREEWNELQSRASSMFVATKAARLETGSGAVANRAYGVLRLVQRVFQTAPLVELRSGAVANRAYGVLRLVQRVFQTAPCDSQFRCGFYCERRLA